MSDYYDDMFGFEEHEETPKEEPVDVEYTEESHENIDEKDPYEDSFATNHVGDIPSGSGKPPKKNKHGFLAAMAAIIVLALLVSMGGRAIGSMVDRRVSEAFQAQEETIESTSKEAMQIEASNEKTQIASVETNYNGSAALTDVSDIVENVAPSIVSINCNIVQQIQDMFGRVYTQEGTGSGSGIIIGQSSEEVLIVTNNHVVADAKSVSVEFGNGTSVDATIGGTSSNYDLAVVSVKLADIDEETLNYIRIATLGDSEELKVGEMAIAYGNALGYGPTVTVGYISALSREVSYEDFSMELIQTDAAINPGNSGGALLNARGEVIGINSVKYASTEVEGVGFAIPITDALPIINELINQQPTQSEAGEAFLGIVPYNVTEQYSEQFHMPIGVYVSEVSAGSPAEKAGFQMGDIITGFQGKTIQTTEDLADQLAEYAPGDTVTITVQRVLNGQYVEGDISVTLGSR
ncbi:MAG: trypsin-like peptidase domain-containing protein [Lachnospiraceae bacterium]|nr:trypsin-like peptidase domain-containing protein [Lachnospiraceae bacterium]